MLEIFSKKGVDYDFSSIQFCFPEQLSNIIKKWGRDNIPSSSLYHDKDGSKGRENEIHLTVKYGIHTDDVEEARSLLKDFKSFDIVLDKVSRFSKPEVDFDVVKVEIKGKELFKLNNLISKNLKCTDTYSTYSPHVTVAYVQRGSCNHLSGNNHFKGRRLKVENLHFSPAKGRDLLIKLN